MKTRHMHIARFQLINNRGRVVKTVIRFFPSIPKRFFSGVGCKNKPISLDQYAYRRIVKF